ncbi:MAG TPA: YajQ family cyclic di-GMP-binding protein [Blastocatellia bacterium]|nr:YajQ family cyclic di-GMP-binding protein [Blastocatellia bacterium]
MAQQNTFDVVSKVDMAEVKNAVNQAMKEVGQRFDFKDTNSSIELNEKEHKLVLATASEFTLKSLNNVLQEKLVRRGVSLKALSYGKVEPAAKDSVRQTVTLQQGIPIEKAREIVKFIKDTKLKVQASINGDFVRVSGKDRDTLQQVIAMLKQKDFGIDMQFTNYRSQ